VKILKRFSLVLALTMVLCIAFVGSAYANFGPHGGYANDTDSCAGCHRAHTSFSPITWTDSSSFPTTHTALLVGSATTMTEFCNACHGDTAPGASTNVVSGIFDSGPSGAAGVAIGGNNGGVTVAYQTASQFNTPLNGGGFDRAPNPYTWETSATIAYKTTTSAHNMGQTGTLWGAGNAATQQMNLDCTSCHDPHGTSNYRLLKGSVNGVTVGGYDANDNPAPFVLSNEIGYPLPNVYPWNGNGGWSKHSNGAIEMANYRPNYTDTTGTPIVNWFGGPTKSLSVWCSACHTQYDQRTSDYNYSPFEPIGGAVPAGQVGNQTRHRHPVDVTMQNGTAAVGVRTLTEQVISGLQPGSNTNWVPLETNANPSQNSTIDKQWIGCLTCHRAHGATTDMSGWAAATLAQNASGTWAPVRDGVPGVMPTKNTSNLLRADNRGVCERCHNK
jgi:predicted CXXCH cytochrome family protein